MELRRWSVTDLTRYLRSLLETDYRLQALEIEGEISNLRVPASGHLYFTLHDSQSQITSVIWAGDSLESAYTPRDGDQVIGVGYISLYEKTGQLQFYCRKVRLAGEGDLFARFEALKHELQAEGVFDADRKKAIPSSPRRIAVITSESGAALQDVITIIARRSPMTELILYPVLVQGEGAVAQVSDALAKVAERTDFDICLIVRGGGSIEDLWAFNDSDLARQISLSPIPVITGIGHEIDFTLADFAADLRAPTPSAAAELATLITQFDLRAMLTNSIQRIDEAMTFKLRGVDEYLNMVHHRLTYLAPDRKLQLSASHISLIDQRVQRALRMKVMVTSNKLAAIKRVIANTDPHSILSRGYALVFSQDGKHLRDGAAASLDEHLTIQFSQSKLKVRVEEKLHDEND